jgi:hypothetical protein
MRVRYEKRGPLLKQLKQLVPAAAAQPPATGPPQQPQPPTSVATPASAPMAVSQAKAPHCRSVGKDPVRHDHLPASAAVPAPTNPAVYNYNKKAVAAAAQPQPPQAKPKPKPKANNKRPLPLQDVINLTDDSGGASAPAIKKAKCVCPLCCV